MQRKLWWRILVGLRLERQYTRSTNENFHLWLCLSTVSCQINKAEKPRQTETMHTFWVHRIQVRLLFIFPIRGQHLKTVKTEMVFLFQKASHEHIQCTQCLDVAVCFRFDTVNITTPLQRQARNSFRPMVQSTQSYLTPYILFAAWKSVYATWYAFRWLTKGSPFYAFFEQNKKRMLMRSSILLVRPSTPTPKTQHRFWWNLVCSLH